LFSQGVDNDRFRITSSGEQIACERSKRGGGKLNSTCEMLPKQKIPQNANREKTEVYPTKIAYNSLQSQNLA